MPPIMLVSWHVNTSEKCRYQSCTRRPTPTVRHPLRLYSACWSWESWTRLVIRQVNGKYSISYYWFCSHLKEVANLVAKKLADIPRHTLTNFWHHSVYWLFKYLVFEEIWRLMAWSGPALWSQQMKMLLEVIGFLDQSKYSVSKFFCILMKCLCLNYSH